MTQITTNFHFYEFERSSKLLDFPESERELLKRNIYALANRLQAVRDILGPLYVTSGLRTPLRNAEVGGSPNSFHLRGMAADLVPVQWVKGERLKRRGYKTFEDCVHNLHASLPHGWSGGLIVYWQQKFLHIDTRVTPYYGER